MILMDTLQYNKYDMSILALETKTKFYFNQIAKKNIMNKHQT